MAESIYDKYFLTQELMQPAGFGQLLANFDGSTMEGSMSYYSHWVPCKPDGIKGLSSWGQMAHGPHIHKTPELIMHFGTNPDDPLDLGGEIIFYMGREMEKHVITRSTVVYIPPNLIHCPWIIKRVDRPFIIVQVNQEPKHTEKSMKQLVPEKERETMMFIDEGYDSDEKIVQLPAFLRAEGGE